MKRPIYYLSVFLSGLLFTACNKTVVNFGEESLSGDPNIIYFDTFLVKLATYQLGSFSTVSDTLFKVGQHNDTIFGKYVAQSWFQPGIPANNGLKGCTNCSFDSMVFMTRFSGSSYGDTTEAFTLQVHRLTQQIDADYGAIGYNISHFDYDPVALAATTINNTRPSGKQAVFIHMPDDLGQDFFSKLKRNSDTITNQDKFIKLFKGLVLKGKGTNNKSVYYFGLYDASSFSTVRLYYSRNGSSPAQDYVDFPLQPAAFQFNSFEYDKTGTSLAQFLPKKKQTISSTLTGNKVFLHSGSGIYPRLSLPDMLALKELYPYIKVVKATLEIIPRANDYGQNSIYALPPALGLYRIDDVNTIGSGIADADGYAQTGNLVIDYLYHKDTRYSYDLTAYVNTILTQGRSAQEDLLLLPQNSTYENRLILNAAGQEMSVKLKLYVLGL
jgi:hypothetical protein